MSYTASDISMEAMIAVPDSERDGGKEIVDKRVEFLDLGLAKVWEGANVMRPTPPVPRKEEYAFNASARGHESPGATIYQFSQKASGPTAELDTEAARAAATGAAWDKNRIAAEQGMPSDPNAGGVDYVQEAA